VKAGGSAAARRAQKLPMLTEGLRVPHLRISNGSKMSRFAALALLPLVLGGHARAADKEGKVITLFCVGTLTRTYGANKPADPEPLQKTGVVVNLDEQTVFFLATSFPSRMSMRPVSISARGRPSTTDSESASEATLIGQVVAWT
jgi:hypothetical protein